MLFACTDGRCKTPRWMRNVLLGAGIYHLLYAAWSILWPHWWFDWIGFDRLNHPRLCQGVGLLVGVLGIYFLVVATNPIRHSRWGSF